MVEHIATYSVVTQVHEYMCLAGQALFLHEKRHAHYRALKFAKYYDMTSPLYGQQLNYSISHAPPKTSLMVSLPIYIFLRTKV